MALFRFHSGGAAARKLDLPDDLDELDLEELEELDDLGGSSASKDAAESGPGPSCSEGDNETPLTLGNPVDKPVEILPAPPTVSSKAKTKPAARARSVAKSKARKSAVSRAAQPARVVAEIGDETVRIALAEDGRPGDVTEFERSAHAGFAAMFEAWAGTRTDADALVLEGTAEAAVATAAGADGAWSVDSGAIAKRLDGARVATAAAAEAVALALPHLGPRDADLRFGTIDGDAAPRPMVVIRVGEALETAIAVPGKSAWSAIPAAAGRMAFTAVTADEQRLLSSFPTAQDVLSCQGLVKLHHRFGGGAQTGEQVFRLSRHDRAAGEAVSLFARYLGRLGSDLMLASGAWGGVWLCGPLLAEPRGEVFDRTFRAAFTRNGDAALTEVPVRRITNPNAALVGLAHAPL